MRVISASGANAEEIIRSISAGFSEAKVSHLCVCEGRSEEVGRGRLFGGYAIDGGREATDNGAEALLIATDRIPFFSGFNEGIAILGEDSEDICGGLAEKGFVISSKETDIPANMKRYPLISCGMSRKDTVTFSSIRSEGGIACIQRKLITFSGRVIEPQEFPIAKGGFEGLAAFTALLLCDVI